MNKIINPTGIYSIDTAVINFHFNAKLKLVSNHKGFIEISSDFTLHYNKRKATPSYQIMDGEKLLGEALNYDNYGNYLFEVTLYNKYFYTQNDCFTRLMLFIKSLEEYLNTKCIKYNIQRLDICFDTLFPFCQELRRIHNHCTSNSERISDTYSLSKKSNFTKYNGTIYLGNDSLVRILVYDKSIELKKIKHKTYINSYLEKNGLFAVQNINRLEVKIKRAKFSLMEKKLGEIKIESFDNPMFRKLIFDNAIDNFLTFNVLSEVFYDKNRNKNYGQLSLYQADKSTLISPNILIPLTDEELDNKWLKYKNGIIRSNIKIALVEYFRCIIDLDTLKDNLEKIAKLYSMHNFETNFLHVVKNINFFKDYISVKNYKLKKASVMTALEGIEISETPINSHDTLIISLPLANKQFSSEKLVKMDKETGILSYYYQIQKAG